MPLSRVQFKIVKKLPIDDVIALYRDANWWTETQEARDRIPQAIKGSFCFMAAFDKKQLVGMGRVISDGASDGYIQDICVKTSYRGQHIGKEIVNRLTLFCLKKKLEWIGLIAEPDTAAFYETLGFRPLQGYKAMRYEIL